MTANLDGHAFRLPVTLSDVLPINLIGRVGLMDLWQIKTDVNAAMTEFTWIGAQPAWGGVPWGDRLEAYWRDMLNAGFDWPNWSANGRPALPQPPAVPPALPRLAP